MILASLESRHIVITGASRGIGRGVALACAEQGARLTLCARSEQALAEVAASTGAVGGVVDVRDPAAVATWIEAGVRHNGPIDVLVDNAAILGPMAELLDYPLDAWRQVMDVNVLGALVVSRACIPHMARPHGILAHLTSWLGRHALPRYGAYCASKHAVEGLSRLVAVEHPDELVSVAVDPGMVQTDMLAAAMCARAEGYDLSHHPTERDAGEAFVRLLLSVEPEHSGLTLSLFG